VLRHRCARLAGARGQSGGGALTRALLEAQDLTVQNYRRTAEAFYPYSPKTSVDELVNMLKSHTDHNHKTGDEFKTEIATWVEELRQISVIKPTTDPVKFAERVYADVLS